MDFFKFEKPAIDCVSDGIFESAKTLYIKEVVDSVAVSATQYPEDCVKFAKLVLPALAEGLLNQRGEFYWFGGYSANEVDYPVFNQIEANIDLTPVHNMQQERACGDIDSRLKTRPNLNVASRAMLLQGPEKLLSLLHI